MIEKYTLIVFVYNENRSGVDLKKLINFIFKQF